MRWQSTNAVKRLAEDLKVELEVEPVRQSYVREVGDKKYVRWLTMFHRLYQRKIRTKEWRRENKHGNGGK